MDLYTVEKGAGPTAEAVVVLHGLLGASRNLYRLITALADDGFRVIGYDQRGHGHSPWGKPPYSLEGLAADLIAVLDSKAIKKAHLVGHSLGGRVALAAAAAYPERVASLCMLDAGATINEHAAQELQELLAGLPGSFQSKPLASEYLKALPPRLAQFLLSNLRTQADGTQHWIFDLEGLRSSFAATLRVDQTPAWQALRCPVLVLRGARSEYLTDVELKTMLALQPRARSAIVDKAGHWLHVENYESTAAAVRGFLRTKGQRE